MFAQNKASFQACTSQVIYETFMFTHFKFPAKAFPSHFLSNTATSLKVANEAQKVELPHLCLHWNQLLVREKNLVFGEWNENSEGCLIRLQEISFV
jgi:hypothetical protein